MSEKPIILLGAGGHASVIVDILKMQQSNIAGVIALSAPERTIFSDVKTYFNDADLTRFSINSYDVVVAVGPQPNKNNRLNIIDKVTRIGYAFRQVISHHSVISNYVLLNEGVQVLPGAVINAGAKIGQHVVVNSRAVIEHDCTVGNFSHIAPSAVLCGGVELGENVYVGAGAVILPGIKVGSQAVIGAKALVDKDVPYNATLYGCRGKLK
ncbi:NeuD/PglB/VioB family sugar acetyltransferase [Pseudoalteromonas shioyasakiensis]|uniref:NeuD/PglB/VioB family sugar acetyltransferase n=1 Tax=Pseudoalteromonas shioyasakiensis TaxID=1190813 RepID=UPI0021182A34|nr:NeuD/PglB/VioB family sugar acetyltransferase [Pseudoalteromonas shioyasakiensis]MCQ8877372.1 NeuD/PglB/VioB family sugar acetyltransferase [Pseudoalteromonas shioyasakiensis]